MSMSDNHTVAQNQLRDCFIEIKKQRVVAGQYAVNSAKGEILYKRFLLGLGFYILGLQSFMMWWVVITNF